MPVGHIKMVLLILGRAAAFAAAVVLAAQARAQPVGGAADAVHLGVASCAGNNCHGAVTRLKGSSVAQNEYLIWSKSDKHHKAYQVLSDARAMRIAHNLGLPNAVDAPLCLNCHADNVPPQNRGPQFQLSDGVGCEACHGGALPWLGVHISGAGHRANLAAGLYPTEQPGARGKMCLSCHFGDPADDKRFVTHRIMGAGHPRMGFELDTYTAAEPAHFTVDQSYVERKGPVNDVKVWAIGQAVSLVKRMDAVIDPKNAPKGIQPELVLFDCESCHHPATELRWRRRASTGLGPGALELYDANAVMLRVIAARVAPAAAKVLGEEMLALHHATTESWSAVVRQATLVRAAANELLAALSAHDFTPDDMKALANGVVANGLGGDGGEYSDAEQATMALGSIAAALKMAGSLGGQQVKAMNDALDGLYKTIDDPASYRPQVFAAALKAFQKTIPQ